MTELFSLLTFSRKYLHRPYQKYVCCYLFQIHKSFFFSFMIFRPLQSATILSWPDCISVTTIMAKKKKIISESLMMTILGSDHIINSKTSIVNFYTFNNSQANFIPVFCTFQYMNTINAKHQKINHCLFSYNSSNSNLSK